MDINFQKSLHSHRGTRYLISSIKITLYKLLHELPTGLRLRILGNQKISGKHLKLGGIEPSTQCSSKNKILIIVAKKYVEPVSKAFYSPQNLLDFFTLFHIFRQGLSVLMHFCSLLVQVSFRFQLFDIFYYLNAILKLLIVI